MTGMEHAIKRAVDVLNLAGAHCGECGREPGESLSECPSCERHIGDCAAYLADAGLLAPAPLREIQADAWDEGAEACSLNIEYATGPKDEITNPYRKEADQ